MATEPGYTHTPSPRSAPTQPVNPAVRRLSGRECWDTFLSKHWTQVYLISIIAHCWPGALNALFGLGASGLDDHAVAANATVALLTTSTVAALFVAGPAFNRLGPRACVLLGGWTYPLYIGSLMAYARIKSAAFVIVSGAVLGVGSSLFWVAQGAIITTYVPESQRGRAFAAFWVIFNLGGTVTSLMVFGGNYHSTSKRATSGSYATVIIPMCIACICAVFIKPPSKMQGAQLQSTSRKRSCSQLLQLTLQTISDWRVLCMIPLFFSANAFYPYQQNVVNGQHFTIRTRALNSAFYWIAQIAGALLMGLLVDLPKFHRQRRARFAWILLFVSGMIIWGGGYTFQKLSSRHSAHPKLKQPIDFTQSQTYMGPMFLYFFYGMYDAFWQTFCYWLMGTRSNCPTATAILVSAYKALQSIGGAMVWRLNAVGTPAMSQFAMTWGLCIGSLIVALPSVEAVTSTSSNEEVTDTSKAESEA